MGDWFIATEGVKIVKDSPGLWPQIITAVSSAGAAFGGVWYGQWRITQREKEAAAAKLASERLFIATELVFKLEDFAEACAAAAQDDGKPDERGYWRATTRVPPLEFEDVTGDWRALPASVMYRVLEFHVLQPEASGAIAHAFEHDSPPDYSWGFRERRYQYARLGLRALFLAKRLRKITAMPSSRLDKYDWSPQNTMWQRWRKERKSRNKQRLAERSDT
ncbi:hypothetical protein EGJ31_23010 [Serratia marcescens]|uniref:hypothetical protein n=1 Tax=Serratia marcescens TaxID=615 RepID=UPI000F74104A|nr:hypothetical protein [Serratia marcescens]RRU14416.1 hypothetical protein EGJ16_21065 [Serratia marcescens]RRU16466.1 hypothetical protein EGJ10_22990 [Serratia marcescens]RRU26370.1 hypothetical protein EGJ02_22950 [Serratia marcescens]RRU27875.1 hypothetical protein EGJ31_23010 [Serratia marcescens]RRU39755.1 hypothetical protein EGJ04_23345 [Serratia marcescens]